MCDGTPCPCNILPATDPGSRYYGQPPRAPLAPRVRRTAVRVGLYGSAIVVGWAVMLAVTGWAMFAILGPVTIGVVMLAFLVAAVAGVSELGPHIAARHRHAAERSRR